jgi:hypothetical protein
VTDFPRASNGVPLLDHLPRNAGGNIDVDVYLRDTRTGRAVVHRSPYGNVERGPLPVGPDWREEDHDFFQDYWWDEGNMGCDCNRSTLGGADGTPLCDEEYPCGGHRAGVIAIDKITPAGLPDVVLYSDAERDG